MSDCGARLSACSRASARLWACEAKASRGLKPTPRTRGGALLMVLWLSAALAAIAFSLASTVRGAFRRSAQNGRSFQWLPRSLMVPLPKSHQRYHFGPGT